MAVNDMEHIEDRYKDFLNELKNIIPKESIYTDELHRLAWGTDAGFYRLIPRIVLFPGDRYEVRDILRTALSMQLPVTFRAAGTSLSGQAISDSILIVAGKKWEGFRINGDGTQITLEPGLIGQRVNELLTPYGRKFAPDPASINSAMVGGIVMNNASGMNCGTHANSDKMLLSACIILADGTILDTGDKVSRANFEVTHHKFIERICLLRDKIRADKELTECIRYKYSIKNVTGLNLLPFMSFDDPFDIIAHLMVGSEGTLGFLAEVTMRTEYDYPCKASAMLYFTSIKDACRAVLAMKKLKEKDGEWLVKGAELLDYKSLSSVDDPIYNRYRCETDNPSGLTAVLTETKASTPEALQQHIATIVQCLSVFPTYTPVRFTDKPEEYSRYWAIRSGIFPSVGGTRRPGTTCLIEDVAFHIDDLPEATADLQQLIARHGYDDACIYGHALEGNYHFILNQSFSTRTEVERYAALMEDVKTLVVDKYNGSLKAEHGTGRNMAPFVSYEWGNEAYKIMCEIKDIFDPNGLLNPGVIFNEDPECHLKNFKPLPRIFNGEEQIRETDSRKTPADADTAHTNTTLNKVDRCIECGFCEVNCLSCGFTLSSRQRIVIQREISRLRQDGCDPKRLSLLDKQFLYPGNQTCAGDGLCSMSCPMGINTGDLTHFVRQQRLPKGSIGYKVGDFAAHHFAGIKNPLRPVLTLANTTHNILGTKKMSAITRAMHNVFGIPLWTPAMPKAYKIQHRRSLSLVDRTINKKADEESFVVYFPSCINQTMGTAAKSPVKQPLVDKMLHLLHKAGYTVIFPERMEKLCCGTIWESKGMPDIADRKSAELEEALWKASEQGLYPVLCDQSPCLHRMRENIKRMKLYEPAEFIYTFLRERLVFKPTNRPVAIHVTCSMRKMNLTDTIVNLAKMCTTGQILVPDEVGCCGFAGDRGFTYPELNAYALRKLAPQIKKAGIHIGYSNSRTCEIGLANNSGIPYVSIAYLVDECTEAKPKLTTSATVL